MNSGEEVINCQKTVFLTYAAKNSKKIWDSIEII